MLDVMSIAAELHALQEIDLALDRALARLKRSRRDWRRQRNSRRRGRMIEEKTTEWWMT